jgi:hypothetical protein
MTRIFVVCRDPYPIEAFLDRLDAERLMVKIPGTNIFNIPLTPSPSPHPKLAA